MASKNTPHQNHLPVATASSKSPTPARAPAARAQAMSQHSGTPAPRESWFGHLVAKWREVGWAALASCIALWAAYPPLGLSGLVWLAPLGLLWLIDRDAAPGRLGYFCIWLAGCVFW